MELFVIHLNFIVLEGNSHEINQLSENLKKLIIGLLQNFSSITGSINLNEQYKDFGLLNDSMNDITILVDDF
jgi:hypothetical protein